MDFKTIGYGVFIVFIILILIKLYKNKYLKKIYYKLTNKKFIDYETIDGASVSEVTYKLVNNKPTINIIRDNGDIVTGDNRNYYEPKYILKDNMASNDINSTEYTYAQIPNDIPDKAWTDYRISQTPSFYSNNIQNKKTNLKLLFDNQFKNHNTLEKTNNSNIKKMPIPACYIGKNNVNVCNFNNKLQRIPLNLSNLSNDDLYYYQSENDIFKNNKFINNEFYNGPVMPSFR